MIPAARYRNQAGPVTAGAACHVAAAAPRPARGLPAPPSPGRIARGLVYARLCGELAYSRLLNPDRRLQRRFVSAREAFFERYWREAAAEAGAEVEPVGYGFYRLRRAGKTTFVRHGEVMLDDHLTLRIAGNKPLAHRLLRERGFHTPEFVEYDLTAMAPALDFLRRAGGDCVVKPADGAAGGAGVTTRVNTPQRLFRASYRAAACGAGRKLMIEIQHPGRNYRLLYLNGRFLDAIRRDSPGVTGDGSSRLRELVRLENEHRLASGSALSPLTLDLDAAYTLADQGISPHHVPRRGARVQVKTTSNQYSRTENVPVRDEIHPSIVAYCRRASAAFNVVLSGVDVMLDDHTLTLEDGGCVINEINTTPGLHHHRLVADPRREARVAAGILNHIFDRLREQESRAHA